MKLLEVRDLSKHYGGVVALHRLDFDVLESEIKGVIGPNGAGKTTLFNIITGFISPSEGTIAYGGENITSLRADQIAQKGICRSFQASVLFMEATVVENVRTAFHLQYRQPKWKAILHTPSARREEQIIMRKVMDVLKFIGLSSVEDEKAENLAHGHQRMLGVCLALAPGPKLLLLDEPVAGMNPVETSVMVDLIREIRNRGTTIIVVEHDMEAIMSLCDSIAVLNYGEKIAEGSPDEIRNNEAVIEAYLGRAR